MGLTTSYVHKVHFNFTDWKESQCQVLMTPQIVSIQENLSYSEMKISQNIQCKPPIASLTKCVEIASPKMRAQYFSLVGVSPRNGTDSHLNCRRKRGKNDVTVDL